MQASHDFLVHGSNLAAFDHHEFPGVVARTFLGPLVLALLAWPGTLLFGTHVRGNEKKTHRRFFLLLDFSTLPSWEDRFLFE